MSMISTRIFQDGAPPLQRTVTVVFAGSERPGVGLVIETPPTLCCAQTTGIRTTNASRARSDDAAARNVLAGMGPRGFGPLYRALPRRRCHHPIGGVHCRHLKRWRFANDIVRYRRDRGRGEQPRGAGFADLSRASDPPVGGEPAG